MKKLSILCGMFLMLGLMTGQAFPAAYQIDIAPLGSINTGGTVNLYGQSNVAVNFILDGYACAPDDKVFGVQSYVTVDQSLVAISNGAPNTAAGCDPDLSGFVAQPDPDVYSVICSNFGFLNTSGGAITFATAELSCVGDGVATLTLANDVGGDYTDGFVADCNLASIFPTAASVTIEQLPPPCACSITGPALVVASATEEVTAQYTASQVPGTDCDNAPVYEYSDTCALGDINPATGLLTVPATTVGETCDVCATDTANTGVEPCCQEIEIGGGQTCSGEIYLGGAEGICLCQQESEIPDPPFNRPGRRGLAATCGDIIDFCACYDCDPETVDTVWTVECSKPGLATIVEIGFCSSQVTITEEMCEVLAETATCTVTVSDPVNNWTDSVCIDVGEITVDLSEETVTPETDSVGVDISVINNSNTIRAMDITIADEGDNLVCNECFADPNRALGFICTASEQADGTCRVILFSTVNYIQEGEGVVAQVIYDVVNPDFCDEGGDNCIEVAIESVEAADQFNEELCVCTLPGEVCFDVCGDIYPRDCPDGACACGDGVVNLFDILEAVDIILGVDMGCGEPYLATDCQKDNMDVPNGMPPYCGMAPFYNDCEGDGDQDIYDLMVIIDMALGRMNCCDYCATGAIF